MRISAMPNPDDVQETALRRGVRSDIARAVGESLDGMFLYGSRARGDAGADSDWDILVMLRDEVDWPTARAALRRVQGRMAERFGERVSILPLRWRDADQHGGLLANVVREGEPL
jgi:predicted nucleotidyltransferase